MKKWMIVFGALWALGIKELPAQLRPADEDWLSYDVSWGYWLNAPDIIDFNWRTNNHSLSLMGNTYLFSSVHLGYGLTYTSENYHTNLRIESDPNSSREIYSIIDQNTSFNYNKVNTKYIEIPLELRLQTMANKSGRFWRFAVGVRGGVRISGYSVFKDSNLKVRYSELNNLNRFKAGLYLRTGFGWFNLYGYYGLTNFFEGGNINGLSLNNTQSLNFGISITP